MTPLPRWVFLALLASCVVGFAAHRKDDACVPICRAQKRSPEKIAGACNNQRLVLQSDGDHSAARRLFRACLIPCDTPGPPEHPLVFQDTTDCRSFRDKLIHLRSCSCNSVKDEIADKIASWNAWADKLFRDHGQSKLNGRSSQNEFTGVINDYLNEAMGHNDRRSKKERMTHDLIESDFPEDMEPEDREATSMANAGVKPELTTPDPNLSEEYVDWDVWCMTQCDNGQGGSACNCDIIP